MLSDVLDLTLFKQVQRGARAPLSVLSATGPARRLAGRSTELSRSNPSTGTHRCNDGVAAAPGRMPRLPTIWQIACRTDLRESVDAAGAIASPRAGRFQGQVIGLVCATWRPPAARAASGYSLGRPGHGRGAQAARLVVDSRSEVLVRKQLCAQAAIRRWMPCLASRLAQPKR